MSESTQPPRMNPIVILACNALKRFILRTGEALVVADGEHKELDSYYLVLFVKKDGTIQFTVRTRDDSSKHTMIRTYREEKDERPPT